MSTLPELPFDGTSGWSGSDTSRERAESEDKAGITTQRQTSVLKTLAVRGAQGATWKDLAQWFDWHHGQASGALSVLHKTHHIVRLTERRGRCAVYVLPQFTEGRSTAPYKANKRQSCPNCGHHL